MRMSLFYETFRDHTPTLGDLKSLFCDILQCEPAVYIATNLIGRKFYELMDLHALTVIVNFLTKGRETVDVSKLRSRCLGCCYRCSVLRLVSNFFTEVGGVSFVCCVCIHCSRMLLAMHCCILLT